MSEYLLRTTASSRDAWPRKITEEQRVTILNNSFIQLYPLSNCNWIVVSSYMSRAKTCLRFYNIVVYQFIRISITKSN